MKTLKIGNKIKLKDYTKHADWNRHDDETAEIKNPKDTKGTYPIRILWSNKEESTVPYQNIIMAEQEWNTDENI